MVTGGKVADALHLLPKSFAKVLFQECVGAQPKGEDSVANSDRR